MPESKRPKLPKGFRVPADAGEDVREAADYFLERITDVAEGKVHSKRAASVLKAAVEGRKELCGPIAQKVDVDVKGRLEMLLSDSMNAKEKGEAEAPPSSATPETKS